MITLTHKLFLLVLIYNCTYQCPVKYGKAVFDDYDRESQYEYADGHKLLSK